TRLPRPTRAAVITGRGVVSPLGTGLRAFWEGLLAGRSAVEPIAGFPADDLVPRAAAEVRDVPRTDPDRAGGFALEAVTQALADAALEPASVDPQRLGVALGTTLGGMQLFERWLDGEPTEGLAQIPYYAPAVRVARRLGGGAAADATHMTAPDREGRGAARAIEAALADADVAPARVGFVSAHGTGTPFNDAMEAVAITRVFGPRKVPVNSIKGAIGHTLGAAGAFEAILCLQVLAEGLVPPTAGLATVDPACAGLDLVYGEPRRHPAETAMSTSSGFAG